MRVRALGWEGRGVRAPGCAIVAMDFTEAEARANGGLLFLQPRS